MKLAWLTDIHLNFLDMEERNSFYEKIVQTECDAVLITGDIAEAPSLVSILKEILAYINKPIYFVLGNHDYYRGGIHDVRDDITKLSQSNPKLFWLGASGIQKLDKSTILLGQDGWADGRLGDFQNSRVALNDSRLIVDLFQAKLLGRFKLLEKMQQLADMDANRLENDLLKAIDYKPTNIVILTHVPPFKEACTYQGRMSDDDWLPFFSSKATGDVLERTAERNQDIEFLVLCGHTHGKADVQILNNLTVKAGGAEYYRPEVQDLIVL
jgi:predicted MPP superfamily phosphohydrolase